MTDKILVDRELLELAVSLPSKENVEENHKGIIDRGRAHIGFTNPEDSYEVARKKLTDLICWSIQVDRDLNPADALVEALEEIAKAPFTANADHMRHIAKAALAAAKGEK
jgi:hypothetical protein